MRGTMNVVTAVMLTTLLAAPLRAQVLEWARCYEGTEEDWDSANAVAVDAAGFVYVTGAAGGWGRTSTTPR